MAILDGLGWVRRRRSTPSAPPPHEQRPLLSEREDCALRALVEQMQRLGHSEREITAAVSAALPPSRGRRAA